MWREGAKEAANLGRQGFSELSGPRRLKAEGDRLFAPNRGQIHHAPEAEAAWQSARQRRNDEGGVEKSQRKRLPN